MTALAIAPKPQSATVKLRILRGVYVDRRPRKQGKIVEVALGLAAELLTATRAELVDEADRKRFRQEPVTQWADAPKADAPRPRPLGGWRY